MSLPGELHDVFEKALEVYRGYYDVNPEDPAAPFHAEAVFRLHNEQYFLVKRAKISEADSYEYVFFYKTEYLTPDMIRYLDELAWNEGLSRVKPHENHKNSDVTLFVVASQVDPECAQVIKKAKHFKNYRYGLHGFSVFRLVVYDVSEEKAQFNRRGSDLKDFVRGIEILKEKEKEA